jgi:hypothetical protein
VGEADSWRYPHRMSFPFSPMQDNGAMYKYIPAFVCVGFASRRFGIAWLVDMHSVGFALLVVGLLSKASPAVFVLYVAS